MAKHKLKKNPDGGVLAGVLLAVVAAGGGYYAYTRFKKGVKTKVDGVLDDMLTQVKFDTPKGGKLDVENIVIPPGIVITKSNVDDAVEKQQKLAEEAEAQYQAKIKAEEDAAAAKTQEQLYIAKTKLLEAETKLLETKAAEAKAAEAAEFAKLAKAKQDEDAAAAKVKADNDAKALQAAADAGTQAAKDAAAAAQHFKDWTTLVTTVWAQTAMNIPDPPGFDAATCDTIFFGPEGSQTANATTPQERADCIVAAHISIWTDPAFISGTPLEVWKALHDDQGALFAAEKAVKWNDKTLPIFTYLMAVTAKPDSTALQAAVAAAGAGVGPGARDLGNWANWDQTRRELFIAKLQGAIAKANLASGPAYSASR